MESFRDRVRKRWNDSYWTEADERRLEQDKASQKATAEALLTKYQINAHLSSVAAQLDSYDSKTQFRKEGHNLFEIVSLPHEECFKIAHHLNSDLRSDLFSCREIVGSTWASLQARVIHRPYLHT